jgi:hypothetical protein
MTEMAKVLGQKWRELTDEGKQPYKEMADEDKTRYTREIADAPLAHGNSEIKDGSELSGTDLVLPLGKVLMRNTRAEITVVNASLPHSRSLQRFD